LRLEILRLQTTERRRLRALHVNRVADARAPFRAIARRLPLGARDVGSGLANDGAACGLRAVRRAWTTGVRGVARSADGRLDRSVDVAEVRRTTRAGRHGSCHAHARERDPGA